MNIDPILQKRIEIIKKGLHDYAMNVILKGGSNPQEYLTALLCQVQEITLYAPKEHREDCINYIKAALEGILIRVNEDTVNEMNKDIK